MKETPNVISVKDLLYIEDMLNWNFIMNKKIYSYLECIEDEEIKNEISRIEKTLKGRGRVLIRPSGTEPLVRVMLEGENQQEINELADNLANMIMEKCN